MKLIYLPTNRKLKIYESMAKQLLQNHPDQYIRAELPKYWRVEVYDKSLEWAKKVHPKETNPYFKYIGKDGYPVPEGDINFKDENHLSRAEFEYHIYNHWKEGQAYAGTFGNEKRTEAVHSFYIKTTATNKAECEPTKQPHYNQQPIEVIDMMLSVYGKEAVKHFCLLNSFKYRMRAGHKDDALQDIEKAKWYEAKAKEIDGTPTT